MKKNLFDNNIFPDIQSANAYLEKAVNYEKKINVGYDKRNFNLKRMRVLLERLGQPQESFKSIHIAGTKGKGSSAAIIETCLRECGIKTGLHTSPHLNSICERMMISGITPAESQFCRLLESKKPVIDQLRNNSDFESPTYFELTVAISFAMFAEQAVDWAVVEVGLGGRLDATNVINPEICLITPIGFDHMDKLGNTAEAIASEKAGILKPHIPLILSRQDYPDAASAILNAAKQRGCPVWKIGKDITWDNIRPVRASHNDQQQRKPGWEFNLHGPEWKYENLYLPLLGRHQVHNAAAGIGVMEMLKYNGKISFESQQIKTALSDCNCPARVELVSENPPLILDTAHTVESAKALKEAIKTHFPDFKVHFVFGSSSDKNHKSILMELAEISTRISLVKSRSPRAESTSSLTASAQTAGFEDIVEIQCGIADYVPDLLSESRPGELTCVTGSFFVAGEVRSEMNLK